MRWGRQGRDAKLLHQMILAQGGPAASVLSKSFSPSTRARRTGARPIYQRRLASTEGARFPRRRRHRPAAFMIVAARNPRGQVGRAVHRTARPLAVYFFRPSATSGGFRSRSSSGLRSSSLLDIFGQFEIGKLQQLDRLLQLRRHHQGLALPDLQLRGVA